MAVVDFESARAVADAVLYEGYLLYPYRRSSGGGVLDADCGFSGLSDRSLHPDCGLD